MKVRIRRITNSNWRIEYKKYRYSLFWRYFDFERSEEQARITAQKAYTIISPIYIKKDTE